MVDLNDLENTGDNMKSIKNVYPFLKDHPMCDTHALQLSPANDKIIPNFVGATLPWHNQGDQEYYCSTILALFHPWHTGTDLKKGSQT